MRISDWSSDVCSSDLSDPFQQSLRAARLQKLGQLGLADKLGNGRWRIADGIEDTLRRMGERGDIIRTMQRELTARRVERAAADRVIRSEEHTSELQSLMRISYAVFCLNTKKRDKKEYYHTHRAK